MLSMLMTPFPRGDTAPMRYQQIPLWRRETGRHVVVEEGPSVVPSLLDSAGLDSRWVFFASMTWLRGGSTGAHEGSSGEGVLQESLVAPQLSIVLLSRVKNK